MNNLVVGDFIRFREEKQKYQIQARDSRFLVCTKPCNIHKTVLYCIVDLEANERGPESLVFGMGAETREQCEQMLARLTSSGMPSELSYRRKIPLAISATIKATP